MLAMTSLAAFALFIIAFIIGCYGVVKLFDRQPLLGAVLILIALAIGPGGYSIWR